MYSKQHQRHLCEPQLYLTALEVSRQPQIHLRQPQMGLSSLRCILGSFRCIWGNFRCIWGNFRCIWGSLRYHFGSLRCIWGSFIYFWGRSFLFLKTGDKCAWLRLFIYLKYLYLIPHHFPSNLWTLYTPGFHVCGFHCYAVWNIKQLCFDYLPNSIRDMFCHQLERKH